MRTHGEQWDKQGTWDLFSTRTTNTRLSNIFSLQTAAQRLTEESSFSGSGGAYKGAKDPSRLTQRYFYTFNTHNMS